jgi:hypothetical protein
VIKSRRNKWEGHVALMGEMRNVYKCMVGKHEGKRPVMTHRSSCDNNVKTYLRGIACGKE